MLRFEYTLFCFIYSSCPVTPGNLGRIIGIEYIPQIPLYIPHFAYFNFRAYKNRTGVNKILFLSDETIEDLSVPGNFCYSTSLDYLFWLTWNWTLADFS